MKQKSLLALSIAGSMFFYSCGKEDVNPDTDTPTEFSEKTVEENKAELEDNGLALIQEMETLKGTSAADAFQNLASLLESFGSESDMGGSAGGRMIKTLGNIRNGKTTAADLFSTMNIAGPVPSGDPASFQEFFDMYAGTYTWVEANQDWDFTAGEGDVIFKFPAVEGGASNNAVLTLGDYQGKVMDNPLEDYEGDLPTKLSFDLKVDGSSVMGYTFSASYNADGEPSSLASAITVAPFTFGVNMTNSTAKVGLEYSLKNNDRIIMLIGADASGNFSSELADNEQIETSDIVTEAAAHFQLLNIKLSGTIDVDGLTAELNKLDDEAADYTQKEAELLNKYYELVVYYADSKQKIADTEFYTYEAEEEVWEYNYETGEYDSKIETYTELGVRLIFADGSKSDLENYFETGFADFEAELENFIDSLN